MPLTFRNTVRSRKYNTRTIVNANKRPSKTQKNTRSLVKTLAPNSPARWSEPFRTSVLNSNSENQPPLFLTPKTAKNRANFLHSYLTKDNIAPVKRTLPSSQPTIPGIITPVLNPLQQHILQRGKTMRNIRNAPQQGRPNHYRSAQALQAAMKKGNQNEIQRVLAVAAQQRMPAFQLDYRQVTPTVVPPTPLPAPRVPAAALPAQPQHRVIPKFISNLPPHLRPPTIAPPTVPPPILVSKPNSTKYNSHKIEKLLNYLRNNKLRWSQFNTSEKSALGKFFGYSTIESVENDMLKRRGGSRRLRKNKKSRYNRNA